MKSYNWLESWISGIKGDNRHWPADVIEFTWNVVIELKTKLAKFNEMETKCDI